MEGRSGLKRLEFGAGGSRIFDELLSIPIDKELRGVGRSGKPVILVFPFNFLSHYLRCIVLGQWLGGAYDMRFAADNAYDMHVHRAGFTTFDCVGWSGSSILAKLRKFDFSWLNEADLERLFWEKVEAIIQFEPEVVIGDNDPVLRMAAEYAGVWYVSLHNGYMTKYFAGERTISRRHALWPMINRLPRFLGSPLVRFGEAFSMRRIHAPFRRLRRRYGLSRTFGYLDEMEGDMNLICDLPDLFPQRDLPANYYNIGPLIYDELHDDRYDMSALDKNKRTIYVNMGSTGDWQSVSFLNDLFYRKYNVVTAGDLNGVLPAADIRFSFLPASAIFPHTDLVICHGGNGIINQALYYKKRVLCKTAYFEQEWNVDALERSGWGRSLDGVESEVVLQRIVDAWVSTSHYKSYIGA